MEVGDAVLHPRYGVGIIDSIEVRVQNGQERAYYVIPKPSIASTIFVPVDSAEEVGLRPLASPDTLQKAVEILKGNGDDGRVVAKARDFSCADPVELALIIRQHAQGPKSRYPKVSEQQQLRRAKKLLGEELKHVLGLSEEAIAAFIESNPASDEAKLARD